MRPPCEIVIRELLPKIRAGVARRLSEEDMSQSEIGDSLGITQAAVSKYLGKTPEIDENLQSLVENISDMIITGTNRPDQTVKAICRTCMYLRIGSSTCKRHRELISALEEADCRICSELLGDEEKEFSNRAELLQDMEEAVRIIETIPNFDILIPQVRANLASCDASPKSIRDVISIPGRITLLKNRAHAVGAPEFGSSEHTAKILLWGNKIRDELHSCLCLSGESVVREAAEAAGFDIIQVQTAARSAEEIVEKSRPLVNTSDFDSEYPAIHVPGGVGVEPILYLFGPGPIPLAHKCRKMAKSL